MIHNEYTRENPRINRQDRRKVTFPGSAYPKEIPAVHSRYTHRSSTLPGGLGVFHPCLWPLKAPGSTLGEGRQASRQPADASTPTSAEKLVKVTECRKRAELRECRQFVQQLRTGWDCVSVDEVVDNGVDDVDEANQVQRTTQLNKTTQLTHITAFYVGPASDCKEDKRMGTRESRS